MDLYKPSSADKEFYEVVKKPNVEFFVLNGLMLSKFYTVITRMWLTLQPFRRAKCLDALTMCLSAINALLPTF